MQNLSVDKITLKCEKYQYHISIRLLNDDSKVFYSYHIYDFIHVELLSVHIRSAL